MSLSWLVVYAGIMIVIVQWVVDLFKELLPEKAWKGLERAWAFGMSIILCLVAPRFLAGIPEAWRSITGVPVGLIEMPWQISLIVGICISRGAEKFHDLLGATAGDGNGVVSKLFYKPTTKGDA